MASAPLATVTELVIEALGRPNGSPRAWPGAVREALEPGDLAVLGPVYGPAGPCAIPECLLPAPMAFASRFDEELERVAAASADELVADLVADGLLRSGWSEVARAPRRWLHAYVAAMGRAWQGTRPLWDRAGALHEREVERVGVALARGAFDQLLDGLHPRGRVVHDRWFIGASDCPVTIAADLVLVPMVTGPRASLLGPEREAVSYLAYPLPGTQRLAARGAGSGGSATLDALLGGPRANILRRLDRGVPAGRLAAQLQLAPSAVTHHVIALERAGLVRRERVGRHVLVHRRARGTALLHLYER